MKSGNLKWNSSPISIAKELRKERPKLIIVGDYNIAHNEIDIHDPVRNNANSVLPEERELMSQWFNNGFVDAFRLPQLPTRWNTVGGPTAPAPVRTTRLADRLSVGDGKPEGQIAGSLPKMTDGHRTTARCI